MSSINFNNVNACKDAYVNYYYGNNTKGISSDDIKEIENRYKSQLKNWKVEASKDQNAYEIEDETPKQKHASSRSSADLMGAMATSMGGVVATHVANQAAINGITKAGGVFVNGAPSASAMGSQVFAEVGADGTLSTTTATAQQANNTAAIGFMVECTLGLATGVLYQASKPNKDEHKELMELEEQMQEYLSALDSEQAVMANDAETIESISEEAQTLGDDAAETLEQLQKEYEEKSARQEELKAKIDAGDTLTEEEQAEYEQLGVDLADLSEKMSEVADDSTDSIEDVASDAEDVQEDLESTAETVEDIQTTADYAESFDKGTQTMCIMESVAQGLNVASSTKGAVSAFTFAQSGAMLFGSTLWANAFGAMGVAGATMSAMGMAEQIKMSVDIGKEIDVRKEVQSLNTEIADIQAETADALADATDNVGEVVSDIEDTDIPETETPETPTQPENADEDKKPKEEQTR